MASGATMKAISLWQPWASLWLSPRKEHETRHWPLRHRGWLLVHAAKRQPDHFDRDPLNDILIGEFGSRWRRELPRGGLIGAVHIVDCLNVESLPPGHVSTDDYQCGDFSAGRFAWKRGPFVKFASPIPYVGMQHLFNVPISVTEGLL